MKNKLLHQALEEETYNYIIIDENFNILEISGESVKKFADCPRTINLHSDIREGFPELIGLEPILNQIKTKQQRKFSLPAIAREVESGTLIYFNIDIAQYPDREIPWSIVFLEEVTESLILKQKYVQSSFQ